MCPRCVQRPFAAPNVGPVSTHTTADPGSHDTNERDHHDQNHLRRAGLPVALAESNWSCAGAVSEQREGDPMAASMQLTIDELARDELARLQHAKQVHAPEDLAADIWDSDEEFDAFLADLRLSRQASLG